MAWPDSDYPGSYDSPPDPDSTLDGTPLHSELHLFAHDAIEKMQQAMGTSPTLTLTQTAARVERTRTFGTSGGGTTSGTDPLELMSVTINFAVAGRVKVDWAVHGVKSNASDRFNVHLFVAASSVASSTQGTETVGFLPYTGSYEGAVSAGSVKFHLEAVRLSGSGTLNISSGAWSRLSGIYIPSS